MMIICCYYKKSLRSVIFLFLSLFSFFSSGQSSDLGKHCSYRDIGDMYMRSFGLDKLSEQQQTEEDSKKIKFVELTENEKRTILFNILAENEKKQAGEIKTDTLLRTAFEDLEFFYAPGREHCDTLFAHLNNTHTIFGEVALAKIIANPSIDTERLRKRQAFIKELVTNEQLFNELEKLMVQMHATEGNILSFWKNENQSAQAAIDLLYFNMPGFKKFNTKAFPLDFTVRLTQTMLGFAPFTNFSFATFCALLAIMGNDRVVAGSWGTAAGFYGILGGILLREAIRQISLQKKIQLYMQKRLIAMATFVSSTKKVQGLAKHNQPMKDGLVSLQKSFNFSDEDNLSDQLKSLLELLETRTFREKPSFSSSVGRILAAHKLMGPTKDEFICAMETIGEVDACLSIAKLYKKHADTPVRYSFAEYVESEKPYINAKGFWNPIVDSAVAVSNDLILGGDQAVRNGIVTGSNTGGKSTALKAISIGAFLAQTFGIVPAQKFVMTPFECITTSFNIKDDTVAGDSLYKAEVMRAKKLVEVAQKLGRGQYVFFGIDELFTGTSPEKGQEAAYTVALRLAGIPGVCYLWATHYPRLTQLEQGTNGVCKNYKMEAFRDEQTGQIIRPFKLEEGISTSNVATDILERELNQKPADAPVLLGVPDEF